MINHTLIIAEAGVNHNGDLNIAKQLIDAAVDAGVDYVKFQSFIAEKLVTPNAKKAEYQVKNMKDGDDSQFTMLKKSFQKGDVLVMLSDGLPEASDENNEMYDYDRIVDLITKNYTKQVHLKILEVRLLTCIIVCNLSISII